MCALDHPSIPLSALGSVVVVVSAVSSVSSGALLSLHLRQPRLSDRKHTSLPHFDWCSPATNIHVINRNTNMALIHRSSPVFTSFLWISERSFSMLQMVSEILGCRLLGSPI